jgi:hypothetical protein
MKHVFIIHSHTTFMTSMGVINLLGLPVRDIIFFFSRNYNNSLFDLHCKIVDTTEIVNQQNLLWKNSKRLKIINEIDKLVENFIGDKYVLYAPHFAMPFAQVLYTNTKCVKGAYIQEGGVIFRKVYITHLNLLQKIRRFVADKLYRHCNRIWSTYGWYMPNCLYKQKTIDSYAISDRFFKYLPSTNHVVKWPPLNINFQYKKNAIFFIFDGFIKNGLIEPDFYFEKCKQLIEKFAAPLNYIKFHPAQSTVERNKIVSFFKNIDVEYEIINDSIPFEIVLSTMRGLTIAGFGSSLLFFARDLGHTVLCMDKWLHDSSMYMRYKERCGFDDF